MNFHLQLGSLNLSFGQAKSLPPETAAWARGDDLVDNPNDGAKMVTPYAQSSWVYVAISRLAEKISSIPFRISQMDSATARRVRRLRGSADPRHLRFCRKALGEKILDSGDVVDLFDNPHPTMNRQLFWEMVVTWFSLRGECFITPLDNADMAVDLSERSPRVQRLITLSPDLFWHIVKGYELTGWRYTGSPLLTPIPSEIWLPSEVVHVRTPNPYLYWRGMSPLLLALLPAGSDYAASKYNQGYWLNNADTGVIVTTEQQATPEQQKAIMAALKERKRKAGTADRPLFLWGGAKVEKPTLNGMETQFFETRKMNRQEIAAIYKVPDSIMGFSEGQSSALTGGGAALTADQVSFIENVIAGICAHLESGVDPVVKSFGPGLVGWFDLDSLPVMQQARRDRLDAGSKAFAMGVAFNVVNQAYDLGFPDTKYGQRNFLPFNLQDVSDGETEPMPGEAEPPPPDKEDEDADDAEKSSIGVRMVKWLAGVKTNAQIAKSAKANLDLKLIWQSHMKARKKMVNLFKAKTGKVINQFRGSTLAKLNEVHLESLRAAPAPGTERRSLVDLIFDQHKFGEALVEELHNPILNTLQTAGNELRQEIGQNDPWQMPPQAAKDYVARRQQPIQGVGGTIRGQLNTTLQQGMDAGETTAELTGRVKTVFNNLTDHEALRVAQTEVNQAYNYARQDAMDDAGIEYKAWLSSHGPTVRPAHAEAEEEYIDDPIPLNEPFFVDDEYLMFPGDDSQGASAGNIINCHCIQLAAEKKDEDEKSITFNIYVGVCTLAVVTLTFPKRSRACEGAVKHCCGETK